ncbi:thioesterase [Solihabitans fulvus]|uniref:Thioesterase n=1 Tax=Solihabitans fulvus TaxID=1892852 RepID=A0A5B2XVK7_9PSEU|nr:alpha/beta fold hydrolase [Solihabitans fulvus]KAA2267020.1 thioesterase [Solihabitans fulvus]
MSAVEVDNDRWIRRFHPAPDSATRLVCLPHAGGSASFFFPVSRALSPAVDVLAVQYPGRQDRHTEPTVDSVPELADLIFAALRPWLDRPLALFGHSMGATVGFEVARRLEQRAGIVPLALFASGRRAPSRYRDELVHTKDDDGLVRELTLLSGTDSRLLGDEEMLRMIIPAIRGDYRAIEAYRCEPGATLRAPIVAFTGDADPRTTLDEAQAWREHTESEFDLTVLSGGHFFVANHQSEILAAISARARTVSAS